MNNCAVIDEVISSLDLNLVVTDRNVLGYLAQFAEEETIKLPHLHRRIGRWEPIS